MTIERQYLTLVEAAQRYGFKRETLLRPERGSKGKNAMESTGDGRNATGTGGEQAGCFRTVAAPENARQAWRAVANLDEIDLGGP